MPCNRSEVRSTFDAEVRQTRVHRVRDNSEGKTDNEMNDQNDQNNQNDEDSAGRLSTGRPTWVWLVVAVVAVVLAGAGYLIYDATQNDDETESTVPADGGVIELPQNPSLALTLEEGVWYVTNDGNVTMSDVAVQVDGGEVVCEIGTMSPDDRQPCEGAGVDQSLVVSGQGPQGQPVEAPSD